MNCKEGITCPWMYVYFVKNLISKMFYKLMCVYTEDLFLPTITTQTKTKQKFDNIKKIKHLKYNMLIQK